MDKYKDNGILLEISHPLKLSKEVMRMAENNPELLNAVFVRSAKKWGWMRLWRSIGCSKASKSAFLGLDNLSLLEPFVRIKSGPFYRGKHSDFMCFL